MGAYAYSGLNFGFGITRREKECLLYRCGQCANWTYVLEARNYGCPASAMAKSGGNGLVPSVVEGWSVSTTAHVAIQMGTAVPVAA